METPPPYSQPLFEEAVKNLAFYLFVLRGCQEDQDMENWLEAEARLKEMVARDFVPEPEIFEVRPPNSGGTNR